MTNKDVVNKFLKGQRTSSTKNLSSDGMFLYSYNTAIASVMNGKVIITDYMGPHMISMTTSQHVSLLKRECAKNGVKHTIVEPRTPSMNIWVP